MLHTFYRYGYVDFKTEDDCRAADLQYMEKPAEADGSKLFIRPVWPGETYVLMKFLILHLFSLHTLLKLIISIFL